MSTSFIYKTFLHTIALQYKNYIKLLFINKPNLNMGDPMMRRSGAIAIIVLFVLVMAAFLNMFLLLPSSNARVVDKFTDGTSELVGEFPGTTFKEIEIPAVANITKVTLNISTMDFGGVYPEDIKIIFGDSLPYDWAFRGEGHGAYGNQRYFSKGQTEVNLSHEPDKINDTVTFYLPRNAEITSAYVTLRGFEYDYWEPWLKEINFPDSNTNSWNQDPYPIVFPSTGSQKRLWVFYRSYNETETDESDADLCYNYTLNGVDWLSASVELTPSPDTPNPYPADATDPFTTHLYGDYHPVAIEFNNKLGVFWGSASVYNIAPSNGITNGTDRDIVCQWWDASTGWGPYVEISAPDTNAQEDNYTLNPGPDPWGKDDRRPNVAVFKGKVYCIWSANNTGNTTFWRHNEPDEDPDNPLMWWEWNRHGDIMISNSSDGINWDKAKDLTAGDRFYDTDFAPALYNWNDEKLFAIWETNGPQYINISGNWTKRVDVVNKFDWDIVYKYTTDGITWSDFLEMTPKNDTPQGEVRAEFSYPDEDPRLVSYFDPVANEDRLYCIWRTRNPNITNGTDYDIVLWYTTDGLNWQADKEMTAPENGNFDNKPELTLFNGKLYVVWRREQGERWENNPDGDIVTRHWDGNDWSVLQEITPWDGDGTGRDDFYPNSVAFNNKFYTFWCTRNRGTGWPDGTDADVVYRVMQPSDLPFNTGLDIGGDDIWELSNVNTPLTDAAPSRTVNIKDALNAYLANDQYVAENLFLDSYGNEMVSFLTAVYIDKPGRVRLENLDIKYTCTLEAGDGVTVSPDLGENPFRKKINEYVASNPHLVDQNGFIKVKLQATSTVAGKIKVHDMHLNYNLKPSLTLLTPIVGTYNIDIKKNVTGEYTITWADEDIDDNAEISLYFYPVGTSPSNAKLIVDDISEDDSTDSYTWVFTKDEAPTGSYRIFGRISDGVDTVDSEAPGILNITWEKQYPPWIRILKPMSLLDKAWDFYQIKWEDYDANSEDNAKIYLYYTEKSFDYENATMIDIDKNGILEEDFDFIYEDEDGSFGSYDWDISGFAPGSSYFICAKINDGYNDPVWNCSKGRVVKQFIPAPQNFTIEDDINSDPAIFETHSRSPRLNWRMEYATTEDLNYHITVWKGTSSSGTKIDERTIPDPGTTVISSVVGAVLEFGETYYAEIYAISSSGALSETASLQFTVVNRVPITPNVVITPTDPITTDSLNCEILSSDIDEDGDPIIYTYKWYKNDNYQSNYDNLRNIVSTDTEKTQEWKVEVTPHDGYVEGPIGSASVIIGNARPTCRITQPTGSGEYYDTEKVHLIGVAEDADNDEITLVAWYLDLEDPVTLVNATIPIKESTGPDAVKTLNFKRSFSRGSHNLTLVVYDSDSQTAGKPSTYTITFNVQKGTEEDIATSDMTLLASGIAAIIIILIIIILFLIFMKRRKPVSEREKMYGSDKGLKPGEAYPVEEGDKYFGDELDRKGVLSLEGAPPTDKLSTGEEIKAPAVEGKTEQPQLPPAGKK